MLALTGPAAEYGTAFQNGIEMARQESPKRFSKLEFVYQDHKIEAKTAVTVLNKLINVDKVDVILNWSVPTTAAVAPITERRKVPLITSSVDASSTLGMRYVIRTVNHTQQLSQALMKYLREQGYKRLAVLMVDDLYFHQLLDGLRNDLRDDQTIDIAGTFQFGDNDFKPYIARINRGSYDAVGIFLIPGQISLFYRQAAALGFKLPTFGTDIFESKTEIAQAMGYMTGAVYANLDIPASFASRYMTKFANDNQIAYAYNGYLTALLLADALSQLTPGAKALQIINAIEDAAHSKKEYLFRDTKEGGKFLEFPLVVKEIRGDQIKVLDS